MPQSTPSIEELQKALELALAHNAQLQQEVKLLREKVEIIGGDLCGGWSPPRYETTFQKFAGWFDHPEAHEPSRQDLLSSNLATLEKLWPALTGSAPK